MLVKVVEVGVSFHPVSDSGKGRVVRLSIETIAYRRPFRTLRRRTSHISGKREWGLRTSEDTPAEHRACMKNETMVQSYMDRICVCGLAFDLDPKRSIKIEHTAIYFTSSGAAFTISDYSTKYVTRTKEYNEQPNMLIILTNIQKIHQNYFPRKLGWPDLMGFSNINGVGITGLLTYLISDLEKPLDLK
ncbi:hypothetical protein BJ508DRAFT_314851 [Ascobolus immersus RN42]|uniref:Uncharacterized protein n=1 Tax=Ascobolus immersus RN42 TaxID=1160509 RepID=A0A3N4HDD0_ASCIM|nr:hypothetical protein BJ508DRAFT_314851 [Ascobolus immersus RN42]